MICTANDGELVIAMLETTESTKRDTLLEFAVWFGSEYLTFNLRKINQTYCHRIDLSGHLDRHILATVHVNGMTYFSVLHNYRVVIFMKILEINR